MKRLCWMMAALWSTAPGFLHAGEAVPEGEAPPPSETLLPPPLPEGVPTLQMSADFAPPGLSLGSYAPISQVPSRGVRVPPATIRAAVNTGIGYDDNVTLRQSDKVGSTFMTVSPSAAVGLEGARERYYAIYRGHYGRYASSSADNYEDHNITLTAAQAWTLRVRTSFAYDFLRGHTPRGGTSAVVSEPTKWDSHSVRASGSYGAEGAPARIEGDANYLRFRYANNQVAFGASDFDRIEVGGAFLYRVAPKTRVTVRASHADIDHPGDPTLDNTEMRYMIGVAWDALAKTEGSVSVGYMTKDYEGGTRGDTGTPSYEARVIWAPRVDSVVTASARRSYSESPEVGGDFVVNSLATVSWDHLWPHGIRSTVIYDYGRLAYEGLARTDVYNRFGVRASYPIGRSLRAGAELRYDDRDSEEPLQNYKRKLMLLTLETAL